MTINYMSRKQLFLQATIVVLIMMIALTWNQLQAATDHHSEISGTACRGVDVDPYRVSWTSYSWNMDESDPAGLNSEVRIYYRVKVNGTWQAWVEVPEGSPGQFTNENDRKFSGQFDLPVDSAYIQLKTVAVGQWGNGNVGGQSRTTSVVIVACEATATPTATATKTALPTETPTLTATASPSRTPVATDTPKGRETEPSTATATVSPMASATPSATHTIIPTATQTGTPTPTATATATSVPTATIHPHATPTGDAPTGDDGSAEPLRLFLPIVSV